MTPAATTDVARTDAATTCAVPACAVPAGWGDGVPAVDRGLTLVEMLVTLAILAIAAGATALSLGPRRDRAAEVAARALAASLTAAVDRSIATGSRDLLVVDDGGYTIGGPRQPLPRDIVLRGAPPAARIAVDAPAFALTVGDGRERWRVAFDGWQATAARDGA